MNRQIQAEIRQLDCIIAAVRKSIAFDFDCRIRYKEPSIEDEIMPSPYSDAFLLEFSGSRNTSGAKLTVKTIIKRDLLANAEPPFINLAIREAVRTLAAAERMPPPYNPPDEAAPPTRLDR